MKITVADSAGFCFGARRATDMAQEVIDSGERLFTMGHLLHNETYLSYLRSRGVEEISEADFPRLEAMGDRGERLTVLIRAHGERNECREALRDMAERHPSMTVRDGTCPFVEKLRGIAREGSGEGRFFLLIGAEGHPEVQGVMSCTAGPGRVFADAEQLASFLSSPEGRALEGLEISMAVQTTYDLTEWKKCQKNLEKVYTKAKIFDTICIVTKNRQLEADRLAAASDVMIVIGSRSSSNTVKLFERCRRICPRTYLVSSLEEARSVRVGPGEQLSITAGASTPGGLIQEVTETMSEQMENFEELLEQSIKSLSPGEIVEGVITSISNNEVHLDLGAKTTGVVTHDKLTNDASAKLTDLFKVGDVIKAKVIKVSDVDGIATLDKLRADSEANWINIVEAEQSGEFVTGKVTEVNKGGVSVNVNGVNVFVPASQTGIPKDGDMSVLAGTEQKIKIIEIKNQGRKKAIGSIRVVQRAERRAKEAAFWSSVEVGKVYEGPVKSLTSYGAFVDLGGVDGMVHVSELSWKRVRNPAEVVKVGDVIKVYVKDFDREKQRVSLGYRDPDADPWAVFHKTYSVGDIATVKIVSLTSFGAFAEVVPGADGLIHISQIADHKIATPGEILSVGQEVDAKIIAVDEEKKKISLSIRALIEQVQQEAATAAESAPAEEEAPVVYSTDDPSSYADVGGEENA